MSRDPLGILIAEDPCSSRGVPGDLLFADLDGLCELAQTIFMMCALCPASQSYTRHRCPVIM